VDDLWATKSEDVGLIVCAVSFQDFQPTNITDGQMTCVQDCALHYSATRGKKYGNWKK